MILHTFRDFCRWFSIVEYLLLQYITDSVNCFKIVKDKKVTGLFDKEVSIVTVFLDLFTDTSNPIRATNYGSLLEAIDNTAAALSNCMQIT